MTARPTVVWFQQDLRLEDNPALTAAIARHGPVIPVFIWSPTEEGRWPLGGASRWWLHQSLRRLDADLRRLGSRLVIRRGEALFTLMQLAQETHAATVCWNRRCEPAAVARATAIKSALTTFGLSAETFNGNLLFEPREVQTEQGTPYQDFSSFANACPRIPLPAEPTSAPEHCPAPARWCNSLALDELELEPRFDWTATVRESWTPGEAGAHANLDMFLGQSIESYASDHARPDRNSTSCLSPHLHFGEISPRKVWHAVGQRPCAASGRELPGGPQAFLKELLRREFAHHLLYHFPDSAERPLRREYEHFPWETDAGSLKAWQHGRTGYPFVDAAMRQLWTTGWMHNRARQVAAEFLVKHLCISWLDGAKWFWETLVDADLANNTLGWQSSGGCGADAARCFHIFNPTLQGEEFDPAGNFVRRWTPELAAMPTEWIHRPWEAPAEILAAAGVVLGRTYPKPIIEPAAAHARALAAFEALDHFGATATEAPTL